jgi:hypothetical protein
MIRKTCIENYITLRDACSVESVSGFYVEDLEGLSIENIANIAPEKLASAKKLVTEKLYFSANIVESRLRAMLQNSGLKLNTLGKMYNACSVSTSTSAASPFDRGVYISKTWLGSAMSSIWVESIRIKPTGDGTTTIKVKKSDGTVLFSKSVSVLGGVETIFPIRKYFFEDIILVTADTTTIGVYTYNCDQTTSCKPCSSQSEYYSIQGWNGSGVSTSGFIGVCVRLDCTDTDIICQFLYREGVAMAILYQLGAEIYKEWQSPTNRFNVIKDYDPEWIATKIEDFQNMSIGYLQNEIESIIQLMTADKFCYNCAGRIISVPLLP